MSAGAAPADQAALEPAGPGVWSIHGDLSMATVPALWNQRQRLFQSGGEVTLDLNAVVRADSAGLAFLLGLLRTAVARGSVLHLVALPEQLVAMARLSGVAAIAGFSEALAGQERPEQAADTVEAGSGEDNDG